MRTNQHITEKQLKQFSDSELLECFSAGNQTQVVGEFYVRYHHIVYGVCLKYFKDVELAEDAMLHLFSELFEWLGKYQVNEFKGWLLTITRNYCLREIKLNSRLVPFSVNAEIETATGFMDPQTNYDQIKEHETMLLYLEQAMKELKPQQQTCVELFYLHDKSYVEIAESTGYELKKVKSYIQNGKRNLQIIIEQIKSNTYEPEK